MSDFFARILWVMIFSDNGGAGFTIRLFEASVFFVGTREERTAVFFFACCALLVFIFESSLFAFFDGDMDDLHCRGIAVVWVAWRNGHQYIQAFNHLTEDAVAVVQVRSGSMCDKKL